MHKFTKKTKNLKHKNTLTQSNKKFKTILPHPTQKKELAVDMGAIHAHPRPLMA